MLYSMKVFFAVSIVGVDGIAVGASRFIPTTFPVPDISGEDLPVATPVEAPLVRAVAVQVVPNATGTIVPKVSGKEIKKYKIII